MRCLSSSIRTSWRWSTEVNFLTSPNIGLPKFLQPWKKSTVKTKTPSTSAWTITWKCSPNRRQSNVNVVLYFDLFSSMKSISIEFIFLQVFFLRLVVHPSIELSIEGTLYVEDSPSALLSLLGWTQFDQIVLRLDLSVPLVQFYHFYDLVIFNLLTFLFPLSSYFQAN